MAIDYTNYKQKTTATFTCYCEARSSLQIVCRNYYKYILLVPLHHLRHKCGKNVNVLKSALRHARRMKRPNRASCLVLRLVDFDLLADQMHNSLHVSIYDSG